MPKFEKKEEKKVEVVKEPTLGRKKPIGISKETNIS